MQMEYGRAGVTRSARSYSAPKRGLNNNGLLLLPAPLKFVQVVVWQREKEKKLNFPAHGTNKTPANEIFIGYHFLFLDGWSNEGSWVPFSLPVEWYSRRFSARILFGVERQRGVLATYRLPELRRANWHSWRSPFVSNPSFFGPGAEFSFFSLSFSLSPSCMWGISGKSQKIFKVFFFLFSSLGWRWRLSPSGLFFLLPPSKLEFRLLFFFSFFPWGLVQNLLLAFVPLSFWVYMKGTLFCRLRDVIWMLVRLMMFTYRSDFHILIVRRDNFCDREFLFWPEIEERREWRGMSLGAWC